MWGHAVIFSLLFSTPVRRCARAEEAPSSSSCACVREGHRGEVTRGRRRSPLGTGTPALGRVLMLALRRAVVRLAARGGSQIRCGALPGRSVWEGWDAGEGHIGFLVVADGSRKEEIIGHGKETV